MDRRSFLKSTCCSLGIASTVMVALPGCRGRQVGHVLDDSDQDMVGSHEAGSETFGPLVQESVSKLLGREFNQVQFVSHQSGEYLDASKRICFVGVENKSIEELGDFQEQLYQLIDSEISASQAFEPVSRRYTDSALHLLRFRPDELFIPANQAEFSAVLEQQGVPFDYFLFATLTSGTTEKNKSYQRDYLLTLELVNLHNGQQIKENAKIRKGYHRSHISKWSNYNPFRRD